MRITLVYGKVPAYSSSNRKKALLTACTLHRDITNYDMQCTFLDWNIQKILVIKRLRLAQPLPAPPVFCSGLSKK